MSRNPDKRFCPDTRVSIFAWMPGCTLLDRCPDTKHQPVPGFVFCLFFVFFVFEPYSVFGTWPNIAGEHKRCSHPHTQCALTCGTDISHSHSTFQTLFSFPFELVWLSTVLRSEVQEVLRCLPGDTSALVCVNSWYIQPRHNHYFIGEIC